MYIICSENEVDGSIAIIDPKIYTLEQLNDRFNREDFHPQVRIFKLELVKHEVTKKKRTIEVNVINIV